MLDLVLRPLLLQSAQGLLTVRRMGQVEVLLSIGPVCCVLCTGPEPGQCCWQCTQILKNEPILWGLNCGLALCGLEAGAHPCTLLSLLAPLQIVPRGGKPAHILNRWFVLSPSASTSDGLICVPVTAQDLRTVIFHCMLVGDLGLFPHWNCLPCENSL